MRRLITPYLLLVVLFVCSVFLFRGGGGGGLGVEQLSFFIHPIFSEQCEPKARAENHG